jgi:hypothetical protein
LTEWLHLHPDAAIETLNAESVRIAWQGRSVELQPLARGELSVLEGWYCPEFGVRQPHPVLCWTAECPLPAACGWLISWQTPLGRAMLSSDAGQPVVEWRERSGSVRLRAFEAQ